MSTELHASPVAVITGASSGVGEATARALAANGYRVALLARRADRLQALADELGEAAIAIEADVTRRDSLVSAAQRIQDEFARVDALVNNAGVMLLGPFSSERRTDQLGADGGGDLINMLLGCRPHRAFVKELAIRPEDIAEVIAFAVTRPRRMTLNEILVRPSAQAG